MSSWSPAASVVPGDAREGSTRRLYGEWARVGLEVAGSLAADGASGNPVWGGDGPAAELAFGGPGPARRHPTRSGQDRGRAAGWLVAEGTVGPGAPGGRLEGLGVAVKDVIDVATLPTRNGTPGGLWRTPDRSAPAWQSLQDAGASFAGKSATHEMAWGVTTPQIPHPLAEDRSAGGSSGGSAALVSAGACAAALGTDTGGSVRIPAALCGVVGFRPTTGSVRMAGVTALAPEQDVVGTIGVDVATCVAVLEALLGRPCTPVGTTTIGLRVGVLARTGRLAPAVEQGLAGTLAALQSAGVVLVPCETSLARAATSVSLLTMLRSSARIHGATVRAAPEGFGSEARALLTLGEELPAEVVAAARTALVAATAQLFAQHRLDAFLTPTTPCPAPLRSADVVDVGGRAEPVAAALTRFTAWGSVVGMPAVSVPVPAGGGLPVAVQVMAAPEREHVCAQLALLIERLTSEVPRP